MKASEFMSGRKKGKGQRGFSMIEAVIAMALVVILGLSCAGMVSFFAKYTRQDTINTCLLQAASSGIEATRANSTLTALSVSCCGYTVHVDIISSGTLPTPPPALGSGVSACVQIVSKAAIGGKSRELRDFICNFQ